MDFRAICTLVAALALVFGLGFLLAPGPLLALYGQADAAPTARMMARYFGSAFLMYAAAIWALRGLQDAAARRTAAGTLAAVTAVGFVVALYDVLSGHVNALGWSSVVIYGGLALGWARLAAASGSGRA